MREQWVEAFTKTALAYWTPTRVQALTQGKNLAVRPDTAPILLRALGLLHRDALMPPDQRRKFFQINHMVALLRPAMRELSAHHACVRIVDAGCGRSYLTMLLAWVMPHMLDCPVEILGLDRSEALVAACRKRADAAGLDPARLKFAVADLHQIDDLSQVWREHFGVAEVPHVLVSLHACNTATDAALALGIRAKVKFLAAAPCCQSELTHAWAAMARDNVTTPINGLWRFPHLRTHAAASITDAMRTLRLQAEGYATTAVEFVPSHHTPKNTLIRAMQRSDVDRAQAEDELSALRETIGGVTLALDRLLEETSRGKHDS